MMDNDNVSYTQQGDAGDIPSQTCFMYGEVDDTPMVTITQDEYEELLENDRMLAAYYQAGVDNWEGNSFAHEIFDAFNKTAARGDDLGGPNE